MKKRYVQKMTTILLTAAMICSSVPVTAETVSENEAVVETEAVDNTQNDSTENEQTDVDINKEGIYVGEYGDSDIEENRSDMDADYEQGDEEDTKIEDGTEGDLSYSIYQKSDGTKYAVITECDGSAKGSMEIPKEIKNIAVTSIGDSAFEYCRSLTGIKIPESVTNIGCHAFYYCNNLTSIEIPKSVTNIEINYIFGTFFGCSSLTSISVAAGNTVYDSRDNCNAIIEKEANELIAGCKNTTIPEGVTSIGESAFLGVGLTNIEIPEGVTSIGSYAFKWCNALTSIEMPESMTSIGWGAFEDCSGLTSIKIPESVTSIGGSAFENCSSLTSIEIPKGVISIGEA